MENGKAQFFVKNEILYRKYVGKHDEEGLIQLVVPESLREKYHWHMILSYQDTEDLLKH